MGEIGEGIGSAIEGGLLGRAVEKSAGETSAEISGSCLNCGTKLIGLHCHECGQKAQVHRTITAILHDVIHGVLHLDGKFWRTMPMLALKPGRLTRDYIEGKRARYVSPMAIFLFGVFLMFAIFQAMGLTTPTDLSSDNGLNDAVVIAEDQANTQLSAASERVEAMPEGSQDRERAEQELAETREVLGKLEQADVVKVDEDGKYNFEGTGIDWIDNGLIKKWRENPSLMLYKLQTNAYKFSWLLIPLSVPFVWLMFAWKRRFKAYDHAIFVTYSLAFMSLLFILLSVLGMSGIGGGWVFLALVLIPPIHLYKHLRGAYEIGRLSALWRLATLLVVVVVVLLVFLQTLLAIGAF